MCPQENHGYSSSGHTEKYESNGKMCADADEECAESVDVLNTGFVLGKPLSLPILVRVQLDIGAT